MGDTFTKQVGELRELRRTIVDLSEHSSDCPSISPRGRLTQTVAVISGER